MSAHRLWFGLVTAGAATVAAIVIFRVLGVEGIGGEDLNPDSVALDNRLEAIEQRLDLIASQLRSESSVQTHAATPSERMVASTRSSVSSEKISELEHQLAELVDRLATERTASDAENQAKEAIRAAINDPELVKKIPIVQERQQLRQQQLIIDKYQTESIDAAWAAGMTAQLNSAISAPEFALAQSMSTDCRTTMCQIEFNVVPESTSMSIEALNELEANMMYRLTTSLGNTLSTHITRASDGGGGYNYRVFTFREGAEVPQPSLPVAGMTTMEAIEWLRQQ